ncbi:Down syndrome cell adhesion molecule-like protein 1 homolog [Galendromus occidentalis]|uniref:Down syndrome cell adhesion molecule-like protein 1 homolog n=1 Tax=Galendromus occidentalis TaxID=34638 RepID=A0AAJ7WIU0_9ACAR|nr:Down syndrome cell adhesion molecule-like protein 1 homolog [Galendromus occidentalis]
MWWFSIPFIILYSTQFSRAGVPSISPFGFPDRNEVGSEVKATCISNGAKTLTLYKDGSLLRSGVDGVEIKRIEGILVLAIGSVDVRNIGNYTCQAENTDGVNSVSAFLNVAAPPRWISKPLGKIIVSTATEQGLLCEASGHPRPHVSWIYNGIVIHRGVHLPFGKKVKRQPGAYICVAENQHGNISQVAHVSIQKKPSITPFGFPDRTSAGSLIKIFCYSSDAERLLWLKDGTPLQDGSEGVELKTFEDSLILIISRVQPENSGNYTCIAENRDGQSSHSAALFVPSAPEWKKRPPDRKIVSSKESVGIQCEASGYPQPVVEWLKDGQRFRTGIQIELQFDAHSQRSVAGTYSCIASNDYGRIQHDVQVSIEFLDADLSRDMSCGMEYLMLVVAVEVVYAGKPVITPFGFPETSAVGSVVKATCFSSNADTSMWLKDGTELRSGTDGVEIENFKGVLLLSVGSVQPEHSGNYTCRARNRDGYSSWTAALIVPSIPRWKRRPPDRVILSAANASEIRCEASGYPPPQITWLRDGDAFQDGDTLLLGRIDGSARGTYACIASNANGRIAQEIAVSVQSVPSISPFVFPEKNSVGSLIKVTCFSAQAQSLTWFKDGRRLVSGIGGVDLKDVEGVLLLVIQNVQPENSGNYTCVARNQHGTANYSALLNVTAPPKFRNILKDRTITSPDEFSLECDAYGFPEPEITWRKDGKILKRSRLLTFGGDLRSPAGRYSCSATNEYGSIEQSFTISVSTPPTVAPFSFPSDVPVGTKIKVMCSSLEESSLSWRKDGQNIQNGIDPSIRLQHVQDVLLLFITEVRLKHVGNYTCSARNRLGVSEFSAFLSVASPPVWKVKPSDLNASKIGQVAVCEAEGYPPPQVVWLRNGGTYTCNAKNRYGSLSHDVEISMTLPPKFEEKHSVVTARKGENVKLTCEPQGDTPLHIKWSKGNRIINKKPNDRHEIYETYQDQSMKSELFISNTDRNDGAIYTCLAENEHGHDERTIKLLIIEVPQPPRDIKVPETWSRSASISWTPPYSGNSPITKYTVQYWRVSTSHRLEEMEVKGTQNSVLLQDLKPGIAYQVSIVADNAVGSSQPSSAINFTTSEEEPSAAPTDFHVEPKGPHTIRVSWKPPPRDEWNGELRGYYIGYKPSGHGPYSFKTADYKENSTNEFFLTGLQKGTEYSVVAKASNGAGVGIQTHDLHVKTLDGDIPPPPRVFVGATGTSSITVQWVQQYQSNIRSYIVFYRPDSDLNLGWREVQLDNRASQFTLQQLLSGTLYQIYVSATNDFGIGDPSEIISTRTQKSFSSDVSKILTNAIFGDANSPAYLNMFVLIPVLASLVTIVVVIIVTWVCLHRIKARHARSMLAGQAIPMDPKTYMTIARSRMASMDGNCDPPMQTVVRTLPVGCAAQTLDGKQLVGPQQTPKQIPQPEYGQRYVDIQQPPPLPPDHPVGPPPNLIQLDDIEALKRQNVNEEMKTFLMNHNGLPGLQIQQAQQV